MHFHFDSKFHLFSVTSTLAAAIIMILYAASQIDIAKADTGTEEVRTDLIDQYEGYVRSTPGKKRTEGADPTPIGPGTCAGEEHEVVIRGEYKSGNELCIGGTLETFRTGGEVVYTDEWLHGHGKKYNMDDSGLLDDEGNLYFVYPIRGIDTEGTVASIEPVIQRGANERPSVTSLKIVGLDLEKMRARKVLVLWAYPEGGYGNVSNKRGGDLFYARVKK